MAAIPALSVRMRTLIARKQLCAETSARIFGTHRMIGAFCVVSVDRRLTNRVLCCAVVPDPLMRRTGRKQLLKGLIGDRMVRSISSSSLIIPTLRVLRCDAMSGGGKANYYLPGVN